MIFLKKFKKKRNLSNYLNLTLKDNCTGYPVGLIYLLDRGGSRRNKQKIAWKGVGYFLLFYC